MRATVNSCLVLGSDTLSTNLPPFRVKTSLQYITREEGSGEHRTHIYEPSEK
jgi:hypothetical protein